jgi:hypothetical protein
MTSYGEAKHNLGKYPSVSEQLLFDSQLEKECDL